MYITKIIDFYQLIIAKMTHNKIKKCFNILSKVIIIMIYV